MSDLLGSWKQLLCALLVVTMAGCGRSATTSSEDPDGTAETGKSDAETVPGEPVKKIIPIRRDLKSLDGNWAMVITVQNRDNFIWLMRLTRDADGKYQNELLDTSNAKLEAKIESTEIDGNSVRMKIKNNVATVDFQGEFDGIAIRGTLVNGPHEMYLGRLLPTDATNLSDYVGSALPPASDLFTNAIKGMQGKPNPAVLLQLSKDHRTSPIALEHVFVLLSMHAKAEFDDAMVRAIIDQYVDLAKVWGPRMQARAHLICAEQLVTTARMPADALKHLDECEKLLDERTASTRPQIQIYRVEAEVRLALVQSRSKSKAERDTAHANLLEGLKKQPFNPEILLALAEYCAANKQRLDAISYYSEIVALPLLELSILQRRAGQPAGDPTPGEVLKRLWTEEYGNPDDLMPHLEKRHLERLASLREDLRQRREAIPSEEIGDHTVLVEFFTGGQSADTIATEVAVDALRETYPAPKIVALRYHQHIPGPDGLANQDSEDRFSFYQMGKIPMVAVDGALIDLDRAPYKGLLQSSGTAYAIFRTVADPRLKQSTPIRIELTGKIENDELTIQAAVTGVTDEQLPSLRLRLALAEELVHSAMPNGIRNHSMVVREMPGGAKGILPKKGELKFAFSMPAGELQKHLNEYIASFEGGKKIEFPAAIKPPIREQLYLIGWVQNDRQDNDHPEIGRAVLQTAIVPVIGSEPSKEPAAKVELKPETAPPANPDSETPPPPALPE